jgi:hypothetical protein
MPEDDADDGATHRGEHHAFGVEGQLHRTVGPPRLEDRVGRVDPVALLGPVVLRPHLAVLVDAGQRRDHRRECVRRTFGFARQHGEHSVAGGVVVVTVTVELERRTEHVSGHHDETIRGLIRKRVSRRSSG